MKEDSRRFSIWRRDAQIRILLSMSKVGTSEVERLAALARIELTPAEVADFAVDLGEIVGFVEQLRTAKIEGVEPTDQVTGLENVTRFDKVRQAAQTREELLANAPEQQNGYIKVARVRGS